MREKKGDKEGTYVSDGGEVSSTMQIHVRMPSLFNLLVHRHGLYTVALNLWKPTTSQRTMPSNQIHNQIPARFS